MSTQSSTQEKSQNPVPEFDAETEEQSRNRGAEKPHHSYPVLIFVIVLSLISLLLGLYVREHTTLGFPSRAQDGYLALNEFVLNDLDTGKPVQNMTSSEYTGSYAFTFGTMHYETQRGLEPGDSWNAFLAAYGDIHTDSITVETNDDEFTLQDGMTVREFARDYIDNGRIDLSQAKIDIEFYTGTDGRRLYYSQDDYQRAKRRYGESKVLHPLDSDLFHSYALRFVYEDGVLDYLSTRRAD